MKPTADDLVCDLLARARRIGMAVAAHADSPILSGETPTSLEERAMLLDQLVDAVEARTGDDLERLVENLGRIRALADSGRLVAAGVDALEPNDREHVQWALGFVEILQHALANPVAGSVLDALARAVRGPAQ